MTDTTQTTVEFNGRQINLGAARELMDDELCQQIHGTVDTEQEFLDAYLVAHEAKYGEAFVFA
jgi:hypothetical protein